MKRKHRGGVLRRSRKRGVVLLEALFAVMIFSIGITVCLQAMMRNIKAIELTKDYYLAWVQLDNTMLEYVQKGLLSDELVDQHQVVTKDKVYEIDVQTTQLQIEEDNSILNEINVDLSWSRGNRRNKINAVSYVFSKSK